MEIIYIELALDGSKKECVRTDTVFLPISEVCDGDGTVSLTIYYLCAQSCGGNLALIRETVPLQTSDMGEKTLSVLAHSFLVP